MFWYFIAKNEKRGPYTVPELKRLVDAGELAPGDLVFQDAPSDRWAERHLVSFVLKEWEVSAPGAIQSTKPRVVNERTVQQNIVDELSQIFCHLCGKCQPEGARFCFACGGKLVIPHAEPPLNTVRAKQQPATSHTGTFYMYRRRWITLLIIAVIVTAVTGNQGASSQPTIPFLIGSFIGMFLVPGIITGLVVLTHNLFNPKMKSDQIVSTFTVTMAIIVVGKIGYLFMEM